MSAECRMFLSTVVMAIVCLDVSGQTTNRTPEAMVTIKVTDEGGAALTGMPVHVWFSESVIFDGVTDSNGIYIARGKCTEIDPPIRIERKGYYTSTVRCRFTNIMEGVECRWVPWNPVVTAVVRRIVDPVPMYVKKVEAVIPVTGATCGFDLVVGDWVGPHGTGVCQDIGFHIRKRQVSSRTNCFGELKITFMNDKDGFRTREGVVGGSSFPWSYLAPNGEYSKMSEITMGYLPGKGYFESNRTQACYLRVRTVTNSSGDVVSALYGKISGPFRFDVREGKTGWVGFTYYLNPTPNDRNMEFDPKRNLFDVDRNKGGPTYTNRPIIGWD